MRAIVSVLEGPMAEEIRSLWRLLEGECGLRGIRMTPIPHFSWHVAEEYSSVELRAALEQVCAGQKFFRVKTAGLGIFGGGEPVIYIALVKNEAMRRLHRKIWRFARRIATSPSPYYDPDSWIPHITLAHSDVNADNIGCALKQLAFRSLDFEFEVNNLAIVYQHEERVGRLSERFQFGGS